MAAELWKSISGFQLSVGDRDSATVTIRLNDEDVIAISNDILNLLRMDLTTAPLETQLWLKGRRICRSCEGDGKFEGVPTPNGEAACTDCNGEGSVQR
jgi:DnaJ-class molecular chaperone